MRFGWSHLGWRRFWEFILLPSGKSNGGQRQPQQQQQQQPLCPLWAFLTPRCWCFDCVQIFWFSRQRAMSHGLRSFRVESLGIEPFPSHLWRQLTESSNFTLCGQTDHVFWFSCVIFPLRWIFFSSASPGLGLSSQQWGLAAWAEQPGQPQPHDPQSPLMRRQIQI